ncbi:uncharacterized protein SAPINGB_P002656 [Magnusiomyces paraingens]|uniref:Peptidase A1 domain-containing protein n=1 Tax=Magnusiomyces paraingens TaxID=2606893 RepID=A0A5E8BH76_9ASCO|nr:uncharacterized protein SAPINGB_P002656 [Saprochaete ingens]VVT50211.1 unnamed protein product [Saprochaete ingens]
MKFTTSAVIAFATLVLGAPTRIFQEVEDGDDNIPGVLSLDMTKFETPPESEALRASMLAQIQGNENYSGPLAADLMNQVTHYSVNIGIGSGNKKYPLLIDTGSSDFWVSNVTSVVEVPYDYFGDRSKTVSSKPFHIDYVKGSMDGFWAKNSMFLGRQIDNIDYAIVTHGQDAPKIRQSSGILGTSYSYKGAKNLPERLASDGVINKNAYSLSLVDYNGANGNILFGGVDHSKYTGQLYTLPRADIPDYKVKTLSVKLSSITIDGITTNFDNGGIVTPLDTGTSVSYLPPNIYNQLAQAFGVSSFYSSIYGAPSFDVSRYGNKEVTFDFNGAKIKVKGSDLAISFRDLTGVDRGNIKIFGLFSNENSKGISILGDTFLRSAYIVYDLDGDTISLAQANKTPGRPMIEPIVDAVPRAIKLTKSI